jgi:predicted alpha/beta superfamily hydrolase
MSKTGWRVAMCLGLALASVMPAQAQPDLSRKIGTTLADTRSASYRFDEFRLASTDGARRYRVRIAIPKQAAPTQGYPVAYLLDGNAALMELDEPLLASLAASGSAPVIVMIGYDNDLRIDSVARSFDYTPVRGDDGAPEFDPLSPERRSGGADAFLHLIEASIKPQVEQRVRIERSRQTLWGHSYGGLFVLHALFTRPQLFTHYVATDPSLWWGEGFIVKQSGRDMSAVQAADAHLLVIVGTGGKPPERRSPPDDAADPEKLKQRQVQRSSAPPDAARKLVERLQVTRLKTEYLELPGLSHGETLGASLAPALKFAVESR